MGIDYEALYKKIKPEVLKWIKENAGGGQQSPAPGGTGTGAPNPHDLASTYHTGTLRSEQAPQFLLLDGSRPMTGSLQLTPDATIDGVDVSDLAADFHTHVRQPNAHHRQFVGIAGDTGFGYSDLVTGLMRVTGGDGVTSAAGGDQLALNVDGTVVRTTRKIIAGPGLQGGGALAGDILLKVVGGGGLVVTEDIVTVGQGPGISVTGTLVGIATPSTLSAASTNQAVQGGGHTHAITASSAPGVASQLLKTDVAGALTLAGKLTVVGTAVFDPAAGGAVTLTPRVGIHQTPQSGRGWLQIAATGGETAVAIHAPSNSDLIYGDVTGEPIPRAVFAHAGLSLGSGMAARDVYFRRGGVRQAVIDDGALGTVDLVVPGRVAVGRTTPGGGYVTIQRQAEQLRLAYDDVGYASLSVNASGTLQVTPQGDLILDPATKVIRPLRPYDVDLGSPTAKWRSLHAAELVVETLVAQDTQATMGGRLLVGPTTQLVEPLGVPLAAPSTPSFSVIGTPGVTVYSYKVTAYDAAGETTPSSLGGGIGPDTLSATNFNRLTWAAVTGAQRYGIYLNVIGTYRLIGTTTTTTFDDTGYAATPTAAPVANTTGGVILTKHNNLSTNDTVYLEAHGQVEYMAVTGTADNLLINPSFERWSGGVPVGWTAFRSPTLTPSPYAKDGSLGVQLT